MGRREDQLRYVRQRFGAQPLGRLVEEGWQVFHGSSYLGPLVFRRMLKGGLDMGADEAERAPREEARRLLFVRQDVWRHVHVAAARIGLTLSWRVAGRSRKAAQSCIKRRRFSIMSPRR